MRRRAFLLAAGALPVSACGYALVGRGVTIDPSIKRIGVPLFRDMTGKPGLDQKVTHKVIEELLKRGRFDVVQQESGVDAVVEGEILSYSATPVGFSATSETNVQTQASRYAIVLSSRVRYSKVGSKDPIWQNDSFQAREETDVGDITTFFDREDQVIERLLTAFARSLVSAMLEAF